MTSLRSQRKANRRQDILNAAMQLASRRGVHALSLGDLAAHVGTSKSTLLLHFGTKEGLTLAMVDEAERLFFVEVVVPTLETQPGLERLRALADRWMAYVPVAFDGGCLLSAIGHEFDGQEGAVKTRIAAFHARLRHVIGSAVEEAHRRGEIRQRLSAEEAYFHLNGIALALNNAAQMSSPEKAIALSHQALSWWFNDITRDAVAMPSYVDAALVSDAALVGDMSSMMSSMAAAAG